MVAQRFSIMHEVVAETELDEPLAALCRHLQLSGPETLRLSKQPIADVEGQAPRPQLQDDTINLIARLRTSIEDQKGLAASLQKRAPRWYEE